MLGLRTMIDEGEIEWLEKGKPVDLRVMHRTLIPNKKSGETGINAHETVYEAAVRRQRGAQVVDDLWGNVKVSFG